MKMETVLIWLSYQEEEEQPQLFHQMSQTTYVYIQSPAADIGIMTLVHKEAKYKIHRGGDANLIESYERLLFFHHFLTQTMLYH